MMFKICSIAIMFVFTFFACSLKEHGKIETEITPIKNIAPTSPMGWNSWNCFGTEVTEAQVKAVADYMAEHLKEFGWEYVVVDAGWYHPPTFKTPDWNTPLEPPQFIDDYGRLMPDTTKFPSAKNGAGFKPLADYVHSKGLKFGIHIMRGIPWNAIEQQTPILETDYTAADVAEPNNLCEWAKMMRGINMTHPAGIAYYQSIADLYEAWGVDYIKADDMSRPYQVDEVQGFSRVLQNAERDMVLSLSPGAAPLMAAKDLREHAHLWRISNDFWDIWESLSKMFDLCAKWAPYVTENHWPDADMLPIGKLRKNGVGEWEAGEFNSSSEEVTDEYSRFTETEQYTLMNLWAIFRSPLMIGGYLPENNEFTLSLLTNKDLLEINQHCKNNRVVFQDENKSAWAAESRDGKYVYLAVFNLSDQQKQIAISLKTLGLSNDCKSRDIWSKEEKDWQNSIKTDLKPHASILLKLTKAQMQ